ncbi:nucleoside-diphosphate sugar epimerase [Stenotrophomonas panacihumi]|uniref:Nucleoside-diphosphate sugar epimerase n=2 Tax=Stenotrophomonas panacihumi TaxID=676599 RepID=A0A0R0AKT6_9GAMM|nr:SDR family oxidoreductase [Stenotrophomonas panacihumi]KRG41799.1 nucleoside-diphosphate sugar epimerase [Stenotrophomonas panacihumi]PTN56183.1 nucleoside-diphosphate sugar epimerase [Stenotrophomonas panacihumi]
MSNDAPLPTPSSPRHAWVFGGSGQIGERVLDRLLARGVEVTAWSRQPQAPRPGLTWRAGGLSEAGTLPAGVEAVFSCGPLDHFARWFAGQSGAPARVVAFGSTSVEVKADSADAGERDVARRLAEAEATLFAAAAARGTAATVLRPTLVYGAGRDATLSVIAAMARRHGRFVLPRSAAGLRQPVHVDDLADAALAAWTSPATYQHAYAVGGGEVLSYDQMVARVLQALAPPATLHRVPTPLFTGMLRIAHAAGRLRGLNAEALRRMRADLVFDLAPARRDFGYAPRGFAPGAAEVGA